MGIIREPTGFDFVIQSPPLTNEERKEISEFIRKRKFEKLAEKETLRKDEIKTQKANRPLAKFRYV
ncbi:MAG: hypothetical protein R2760_06740 [Chitinophagales bacterium]|nr:hypothetical protein [Bacteroidota bacterium]